MPNNIIRDGYTRRGYVEAVDELHDYLLFEFRPMLGEEFDTLEKAVGKATSHVIGHGLACAALVKHVKEWSEVDDEDNPVPINVENMRRLHPLLRMKLYGMVSGSLPSHPIPDADDDEKDSYLDDVKAVAEGNHPGVTKEVATEKN